MLIDVYNLGDEKRPRAPFLFVPLKTQTLPVKPEGQGRPWMFWKTVPLGSIAVDPRLASAQILEAGFFIQ
jgi:hypothetical protein